MNPALRTPSADNIERFLKFKMATAGHVENGKVMISQKQFDGFQRCLRRILRIPGGRDGFPMKRSADVLTTHHSCTSSVPLVSSSLATSHVLVQPWTTAERSGPMWNRKSGRPRQTWLCTVESDVAPLNIGLATAYVIEHKIDQGQILPKPGPVRKKMWAP